MTRSEALEAIARGIGDAVPISARLTKGQQKRAAQAALQALEEGGVLLSFEEDGSARDHAQSTTVAPPSGLAGHTSPGAE